MGELGWSMSTWYSADTASGNASSESRRGARTLFESMARPFIEFSSNSFPADRQPPAQCRRQLSPPFVREQPPEPHRPPGIDQPQREALTPACHFDPRPRLVRHEGRHGLRFAHLVADFVLADLEPLVVGV